MAWEERNGSKRKYYYQSVRNGGKVTKRYIGPANDPVVQGIVKSDHLGQAEKAAAVREVRDEQKEFRQLEPQLQTLAKNVREAVRAILITRGFRWQKGSWQTMEETRTIHEHDAQESADDWPTRELFDHLVRQANRGDRGAADRLRVIIRSHPDIWESVGDLSKHAETSLIEMISGDNLALKESLQVKVDDLRGTLNNDGTDDVTCRLLVDQIVVLWLEVEFTRMATNQPKQFKGDGRFWEERYERANTRYVAALKELATIRELLRDVVAAT